MTADNDRGLPLPAGIERRVDRLRERSAGILDDHDPLVVALVAIAAVALGLRLLALGARVAHYDEGRVTYWGVHFARTGDFAYRFIVHGPILQHATRWLFSLAGPTDFTMRLPVALVGAALPASTWLFRERLRRAELVGTAVVLALNPVLLYYSRFMRSDLLVAAFMFVALGLLVRFADTRRPRYLYAAAVFLALGFGAKENAVVYVLTWIGATALIAVHWAIRPWAHGDGPGAVLDRVRTTARNAPRRVRAAVRPVGVHLLGSLVLLATTILFIYAPRGDGMAGLRYPRGEGLGLWEAVADPTKLATLVGTTVEQIHGGLAYWFGHTGAPSCSRTHLAGIDLAGLLGVKAIEGYPCVVGQFLDVLIVAAAPMTALAVLGTVLALLRWFGRESWSPIVLFSAYAGFASLVGYPVGTDIFGSWLLVHVLVPLSIPAGVGLAAIYRRGRSAASRGDSVGVTLAGAVIGLAVLQMLVASSGLVYAHSASNDVLVQYAQPENALRGPVEKLDRIAAAHDGGPDVVVYGDELTRSAGQTPALDTRPLCIAWYNPMLPLPWYLYASNASVACERDPAALEERIAKDPPPMLITAATDGTVPKQFLRADYQATAVALRQNGGAKRTFWIHENWTSP